MVRVPGLTRIFLYFQCQIRQVREGGPTVALRKGRRLLSAVAFIFSIPFVLPLVLGVRALRPFVLIRFGRLISNRLGHFALEPELYLCERDAGMHPPGAVNIFYHSKPLSNQQLKKMWERKLRVWQFGSVLDQLNRLLPGFQPHVIPLHSSVHQDEDRLLERFPPHLEFTEEEELQGWSALQEMGILEGTSFVCFHARDLVYLDTMLGGSHLLWRYHDYRDSSIQNYIPAAEGLVRRGYYAVRIGAIVKDALRTANPKIIDYATKRRSDFMDIYLGAKCYFMIVSNTGPCALGWIFRKPIAFVNVAPFLEPRIRRDCDLFIPKKYWLTNDKRFMIFKEILESGAGEFYYSQQYVDHSIELIENTREEITDLVVEMDERLKGTWQTTEEDEELQRRFLSIFEIGDVHRKMRIGAEFLRQNRGLLQ